jgi:FKBP-type peptidyl-prolyl cis-trans isomerase FkpA
MNIKPSLVGFLALVVAISPVMSTGAQSATREATANASAPIALQVIDRKVGEGVSVAAGDPVAVHYTGYFWSATAPDSKGEKFDSSIPKVVPFGFLVGAGRVIKGWDEGLIGMSVGGQRTLIIPADKAYGSQGSPNGIPPNAALVFDIELMSIIGKTKNAGGLPSPYAPAKK